MYENVDGAMWNGVLHENTRFLRPQSIRSDHRKRSRKAPKDIIFEFPEMPFTVSVTRVNMRRTTIFHRTKVVENYEFNKKKKSNHDFYK